ncbi:MAG: FAD-dependent monooxygenase, partial [Xanthobacteraceae bacterium]
MGTERAGRLRPQLRTRQLAHVPEKWTPIFRQGHVQNQKARAEQARHVREVDATQILIVGAGPVGLSLAIELGLRGVAVAVVER